MGVYSFAVNLYFHPDNVGKLPSNADIEPMLVALAATPGP